jgi:hypothetical protein
MQTMWNHFSSCGNSSSLPILRRIYINHHNITCSTACMYCICTYLNVYNPNLTLTKPVGEAISLLCKKRHESFPWLFQIWLFELKKRLFPTNVNSPLFGWKVPRLFVTHAVVKRAATHTARRVDCRQFDTCIQTIQHTYVYVYTQSARGRCKGLHSPRLSTRPHLKKEKGNSSFSLSI